MSEGLGEFTVYDLSGFIVFGFQSSRAPAGSITQDDEDAGSGPQPSAHRCGKPQALRLRTAPNPQPETLKPYLL